MTAMTEYSTEKRESLIDFPSDRQSVQPHHTESRSPRLADDLRTARNATKLRASTVGSAANPRTAAHHRTTSQIPSSADTNHLRHNRISLTFPIQASFSHDTSGSTDASTASCVQTARHDLCSEDGLQPNDTSFLTAIAAQERRVLELKEELHRAEVDLNALKKHWAQYEASRKRDDIRRLTRLQDLPSSPQTANDTGRFAPNASMLQEVERRKAMQVVGRNNNRRVFSSSRHTRTLSLLSLTGLDAAPQEKPSFPSRTDSLTRLSSDDSASHLASMTRSKPRPPPTTDDDTFRKVLSNSLLTEEPIVDREQIIRTGKKMATDIRNGLWTFFEDLRQATVGEEATEESHARGLSSQTRRSVPIHGATTHRRKSSTNIAGRKAPSPGDKIRSLAHVSPQDSQTTTPELADPSFWAEHGISSQPTTPAASKKAGQAKSHKSPRPSSTASSEAWDAWNDSPMQHRASDAGSEANTLPSTVSDAASPRTSLEMSKKEPIPWPSLSQVGVSTLRRTASHLMSEWERSLTPSPKLDNVADDYLGIQKEVLPPTDQ